MATVLLTGCTSSETATVDIGGRSFRVEIANSVDKQRSGLSNRAELPEGTGMLFPFTPAVEQQVWMTDMTFAIDAGWIANGRLVGLEHLTPCHETNPAECPRWTSPGVVDGLIEVPAGALHQDDIGNPVTIGSG